ncbi:sigma-70 family RNA polymerase sigma factor [Bacillus solimangrovi]|uniref:RNA polymerase sigma-70 region 2 domain-containing protein n=1 Tax=Bacillus solimangrovi TaxID=1305675 RepID=A0A1E5LD82_9BACI|nr:sigma-70 family RNA polymerase sigma factor [Bacillus solimangrovi]OEH92034.1 hypothetical protein BFG57_17090 [Bacillus solimangrovi]
MEGYEMQSFEILLKQYEPLLRTQMKKLNLCKDYDFYYQCGCIALWQAYSRYDPTKGRFSTYAFSTVRGMLLSELRTQIKYEQRFKSSDGIAQHAIHYDEYEALILIDIEQLCEELTDKQATWLKKVVLEKKTVQQIAIEAHTTSKCVRSWREEALKKLRKKDVLTLE